METLSFNHLDAGKMKVIVDKMQLLLANYQVFYTNLRGFHWNIKGRQFFTLHEKFEELYTDTAEKVDDIAERILALSGTPEHSFSYYLAHSEVMDATKVCCAEESVQTILDNISILVEREREILTLASDAGDDSTASMMGDYIREQEKLVWMLVAYFTEGCEVKQEA